ncbi:hypothetical protein SEA_ZUKO_10 [Streptomyces phage Zuko]|uniref:Scaffolding protein n=1 Tax=Streptomyces phage Zuko TaxID=2601695 RepID=A0A5J6D6T3_9CAUD|nr:hypothetical protein PP630_gp010 [Streptomyces phage Zuko]QEQ93588.1 hypothetical protein SEA_ZUKO_10 [Streptomyces phage Zuko]
MADDDNQGTETEPTAEEIAAAEAVLARRGKGTTKPPAGSGKETDDTDEGEEEDDLSAEAEAGASDTVPRSELIKAIKARQAAKAKLREKDKALTELQRKNETEGDAKIREATEKAAKAERDKYKPALVKTGATAALLAAKPKKGAAGIPRLIKLMDLDEIEVNEDLELEGVEEEVARLQEEFPELFGEETEDKGGKEKDDDEKPAAKRRAPSTRQQDGAGKKPPAPKKLTTSEIIMKKLKGEEVPAQ